MNTIEIKRLKRAYNFIILVLLLFSRRDDANNETRPDLDGLQHTVNFCTLHASNTSTHIPSTMYCARLRTPFSHPTNYNKFIYFFLFKVKYYVVMNSDKDELPKCFFFFFSFSVIYFYKYTFKSATLTTDTHTDASPFAISPNNN